LVSSSIVGFDAVRADGDRTPPTPSRDAVNPGPITTAANSLPTSI
jgi:hypothetical protein